MAVLCSFPFVEHNIRPLCRDAATILEAHEMLESARSIKDVQKLQSVLATVEGLDVLIASWQVLRT